MLQALFIYNYILGGLNAGGLHHVGHFMLERAYLEISEDGVSKALGSPALRKHSFHVFWQLGVLIVSLVWVLGCGVIS